MQEKENPIKVLWRRSIIFKNFLISGIKVLFAAPYWHDQRIIRLLIVSGIVNLAMWAYFLTNKIEGNFPIILHYNLFFGVDSVGDYSKVFLLPSVGLFIFFLNSITGRSNSNSPTNSVHPLFGVTQGLFQFDLLNPVLI
jgi:hypothetical protein